MFGKTKPPNSVCFRLINQRNYNVAMIMQQQQQQVYGEEERVDENPRNLFLKFVQVIGQATTSVLKAASSSSSKGSSSSSMSSSKVVVFDEGREVDNEYPNLFLKIVKVIGIGTSGFSLVHEPKPALNLANVGGDHNPFNLWCERGFGMMRKFGKTLFKLSVGIPFMTSGLFIMSYLEDDVDFDAALDSEEEEE